MPLPEIGNKAPAFSLKNQQGEVISLKDFIGKTVVLYFYPKALTPGCTVQACGIRDVRPELDALNTVVFGVSPDPVEKLQKFIDKHQLNFDLLSDEDSEIAKIYGVWDLKKFMGKAFMGVVRTTFIIDVEGNLAGIMEKVKTKNHHESLLEWLKTNA